MHIIELCMMVMIHEVIAHSGLTVFLVVHIIQVKV